ncbi:MFS transporter [Nocardioides sp. CFH 31398]|uniref:MFS transporter n=1 Tax=Nocardioides sp. CFH 31398 TaxID=2919579 RepID=UPI001F06E6D0|nr:MFS transporter [Nocardioides sp. CFH 31398]MCH1865899.1 MFS transporter [Nocardioides sp. CFH 31398]
MPRSRPTPRRARVGVALLFLTNGVILSSLLPRYPEIKAGFGLDNAEFGLLVVAFPLGAILAAPVAGVVIRRCGALTVCAAGSALLAASIAVAGWSASVPLFVLAMAAGGALDAVVDAAQNVQGVVVEQWRGRSVINSLHATWSVGAALGGLIGAAGAALSLDLGLQMTVSGAVWAAVAVGAARLAVVPADVRAGLVAPVPDPGPGALGGSPGSGARRRAWRLLLPLVVVAVCGTLVEDVANNWAVLYLGGEAGAPAGVAALGLTVVLGAQFVGRLVGDPLTDRFGRDAVARAGGLLIALGAALAALSPAYPVAFAGFALAGFGCATLVPAAFAAAGRIPGLAEGTGIAIIGWLMRLGFLLTSPAIGVISESTSLRTALVVPLVAGLVAALLAHRMAIAARR